MTLLLDTHLLLWAASASPKLPKAAEAMISEATNELVFSTASIWEVVIKNSLGRSDFNTNPHLLLASLIENGYSELAITSAHALAVANLPDHHKDPFDRILIAQASVQGFSLLTVDPIVASYSGPILLV